MVPDSGVGLVLLCPAVVKLGALSHFRLLSQVDDRCICKDAYASLHTVGLHGLMWLSMSKSGADSIQF